MINAGKYNKIIEIYEITRGKDAAGFPANVETLILTTYAEVKTTRGYTLIVNDTDFEKAFTRFTIRYPVTELNRKMIIKYNGKDYSIEYLNNIDDKNVELEIQAKEITH